MCKRGACLSAINKDYKEISSTQSWDVNPRYRNPINGNNISEQDWMFNAYRSSEYSPALLEVASKVYGYMGVSRFFCVFGKTFLPLEKISAMFCHFRCLLKRKWHKLIIEEWKWINYFIHQLNLLQYMI